MLVLPVLAAVAALAGTVARADNMVSLAITPATGVVTLVPRWGIGGSLAGFHHMAQDLSLGGGANQFYSIKGTPIPAGGDIAAFTRYIAGDGAATNHNDIGSKLTPNSYSALSSADPDLGFGSVNFYLIHHKGTTDYLTVIKPSSGTASAVTDLKPMSGPGGPATVTGISGYFGLTFAAANLGYGLNYFYYLRTDPVTGNTKFGTMEPALLGLSADQHDLGLGGHNALTYTGTDVGYGASKMYYHRLDPITGFTIFGTLDPLTGSASDIANLGSVYSTLTYVPGDVGFGAGRFYATGSVNTTWQSVSFAAISSPRPTGTPFTVNPTASSALPITLTVVPGSIGSAGISGPVGGVFTVTPLSPGLITLQATQAGQAGLFEFNMLRQSFTATGVAVLAITTQPTSQSAVTGTTANFSVTAAGTGVISYQWRKAGANIGGGNASATTSTLTLPNVQAADAANYDVVVTNASGSIVSTTATLTVTTAAPVITSSLTAAGTVGSVFAYTIAASNAPTSFSASPLPAGILFNTTNGVFSGSPTTVGTTSVLLGATNAGGTGNATLVITVTAAGIAPVITSSLTAAGTVGTPFSYTITATNSPTSYSASPLPAGLAIVAATGVISGSPTAVGTTSVLLGATNATGTGNATLVITVAAAGVAPVITSSLTAAGTVGTPFSYTITATGTPTSYSASPLPAGLSIVAVTGVITGSPTAVGTTSVLLGATNGTGTGNATLVITVAAAGVAPVITSSLTAAGTVGTPFSYTITATGTPTSYSASPLPAGLTIVTATGVITGSPTTAGTTSVLLGATNATGTGNATLVITVAAAGVAPVITSSLTAAGTVGTPFSYTITATGTPTSYSASPLPAGLTIVTATGVITGSPSAVGTTSVLLGATNSTGTGNATLVITVAAAGVAPVITSPATAAGTVGTPFSYTITATGTPTSYSASPLPAGLSIVAATGVITGAPTAVGTTSVLLGATNSTGTGNATLVITVAAAGATPVINSPSTAAGTTGTPFSYAITATGTPTSYSASPLPAGLSIVAATGVITGTPTTVGTTAVLLGATNSTGTDNATLTITVAAAGVAPVITSPTIAAGTVGTPFGYTITATGSPFAYDATGLPSGLTVNALTGTISGTPVSAGTTLVALSATNGFGTGTATLTLTVAPASVPDQAVAPTITSATTAPATVGVPFVTYQIVATNSPVEYSATGLPAGLTLNPATGAINGTPTVAGTSVATLSATNNGGTGITTLTFTVAPAGVAPVITSPLVATGTLGRPFPTYRIVATGSPTSYGATNLPPGLALDLLTGAINGTPTRDTTTLATLTATNASGTGRATLTIVIGGVSAPIISSPSTAPGTVGVPFVTYLIVATGTPTSYSATGLPAGLSLNPLTGAINGTPTTAGTFVVTVQATNSIGTTNATVTITIAPDPRVLASRIVNFSARALSGPGDQSLLMGFVVAGDGKDLMVRGIGPGLTPFGVVNVIADPMLTLFGPGGNVLASNDDWGTTAAGQANSALVAATAARVGAFALPAGSKDSALLAVFNNGAHTTSMVRPTSTSGVALTEIYDTDTTSGPRLINVSARMNVTPGEGTLIVGFYLAGNTPKTVLIRGVGPSLAPFGVTGLLADPTITVFAGATVVATNDNWGTGASTAAQLTTASAQMGAFPLIAGSRDAVLVLTLQPGAYTVQVTGVGNTSGVALLEVYDTQ